METTDALGHALKRIRRHRGLSLKELARRSGTSAASLSSYETGSAAPLTSTLFKVLDALEVDVEGLALVMRGEASALRLRESVKERLIPPAELPQEMASAVGDMLIRLGDLVRLAGAGVAAKGTAEPVPAPKDPR
jgi:transcriptional regulator with XRE-family HTH domain